MLKDMDAQVPILSVPLTEDPSLILIWGVLIGHPCHQMKFFVGLCCAA